MASDDGFGLACQDCGHIFPSDVTVGVVGAHMETEHDDVSDKIHLELVMLCPRCRKAMSLFYSEPTASGERHHYECVPCHRVRAVNQTPPAIGDRPEEDL